MEEVGREESEEPAEEGKVSEPAEEGKVSEPAEEGKVSEPAEEGKVSEPAEEGKVSEPPLPDQSNQGAEEGSKDPEEDGLALPGPAQQEEHYTTFKGSTQTMVPTPPPPRPPKPKPRKSTTSEHNFTPPQSPPLPRPRSKMQRMESVPPPTQTKSLSESNVQLTPRTAARRSLRRLMKVGMAENNISEKKSCHTKPLKITAVGDGMVGKTCMLITYTSNSFPQEYVPTVFDNFNDKILVDAEEYDITLWDTAGQEDYERLRPLSYPNTDCFLLCFSIGNKTSYDNIISKWYPELKRYCPTVPIILVATKIDLREKQEGLIPASAGRKLRRKIGAAKYLECSALKSQGLKTIFIEAVRAACRKRKHGNNFCTVM